MVGLRPRSQVVGLHPRSQVVNSVFLFGNSCHSTSGGHSTGPYESSGEGDSQKMC